MAANIPSKRNIHGIFLECLVSKMLLDQIQAGRPIVNNNYRPNGGGSRPSQWGTQNGNWAAGNSGPSSGYAPPNNNVGPLGITQRPPTIITARIPTNGIVGP